MVGEGPRLVGAHSVRDWGWTQGSSPAERASTTIARVRGRNNRLQAGSYKNVRAIAVSNRLSEGMNRLYAGTYSHHD